MDAREELCQKLMDIVDIGYDLMAEYDSLPHQYGEVTMYQAESKVIQYIGRHKSATITEIAASNGKTPSAYSQIIRAQPAQQPRIQPVPYRGGLAGVQRPPQVRASLLCAHISEAGDIHR